jgi:hypothetical protein
VVQDYIIDTLDIQNQNNPNPYKRVNEMKNGLELYDPWRLENPD